MILKTSVALRTRCRGVDSSSGATIGSRCHACSRSSGILRRKRSRPERCAENFSAAYVVHAEWGAAAATAPGTDTDVEMCRRMLELAFVVVFMLVLVPFFMLGLSIAPRMDVCSIALVICAANIVDSIEGPCSVSAGTAAASEVCPGTGAEARGFSRCRCAGR